MNVTLTSNSTHFTMEPFSGSTIADNSLIHEAFQSLETAVETKLNSSGAKAALDVDHLITLSGVSAAADHLGTFSGSTINDNVTVKTALQALETAVEAAEETAAEFNVDHIITMTGVASASDHLGTFTGSTISDNQTIKAAIQALETSVETKAGKAVDETITGNYTFDELITSIGMDSSGSKLEFRTGANTKVTMGGTTTEGQRNLVLSAGENIHFLADRDANDSDGSIAFHFNDDHDANLTTGDATWLWTEDGKMLGKNAATHLQHGHWTTTERDAGTFAEGAQIYNSTTNKPEFYDGSNWLQIADASGDQTFAANVTINNNLVMPNEKQIIAGNNKIKARYSADSVSNCFGIEGRENIFFAVDSNNNTNAGVLGIRFNGDLGSAVGNDDMDFIFKELDANEFKFQPKDARAHIQHSAWTSTERDNATQWSAGAVIWNSTPSKLQVYNGSAWVALH